jgi:hypothetical protein
MNVHLFRDMADSEAIYTRSLWEYGVKIYEPSLQFYMEK